MIALPVVASLSEAWVLALERVVAEPGGRLVHLVATVSNPRTELPAVRRVLDDVLDQAESQSVNTVAGTIFPSSLYPDPGFDWLPGISQDKQAALDAAADALYASYVDMLPLLLTASGNSRGTYFARMVTWPGRTAGGVNQLAARVTALRSEHNAGRRRNNTNDIDVAADAACDAEAELRGLQVYAATDNRRRSFPCLTHVDLTLHNGQLNLLAVYRHQYLIDKAYGNMVGLSRLLCFLCQQTGYEPGEMVVHASMADAQRRDFPAGAQLAAEARSALDDPPIPGEPRGRSA